MKNGSQWLTLVVPILLAGCLTGCASPEKRDAFLPGTTRNVEQAIEKLNAGQQALAAQHQELAAGGDAEALAALTDKVVAIEGTITGDLKNGLDATIPALTKAYDEGVSQIVTWLQGLGVVGLGAGGIAGRKTIAKVLSPKD